MQCANWATPAKVQGWHQSLFAGLQWLSSRLYPNPSSPLHVEYLFSFQNTIICVTEGKKVQLDHGIAQNIGQLPSVRANRRRKIDDISNPAMFGITTTFIEWAFIIKYEDESVLRSKLFVVNPESAESITNIIGRITGLIQKCNSDAGGGQPPASRQKSNTEGSWSATS